MGREDNSKCYKEYVVCVSGLVQDGEVKTCGSGQLFDFTTLSCQDRDSFYCSVLPPISLTATPVSSSAIKITWETDSLASQDGFVIKAEPDDPQLNQPPETSLGQNIREKLIEDLTANSLYKISIKAIEGSYESTWSEISNYTYPVTPDVTVSGTTTESVSLATRLQSTKADNVRYTQIQPTGEDRSVETSTDSHSFSALQPATVYVFKAEYIGSESGLVSIEHQNLTAVTVPLGVENLTADNLNTTDQLFIAWEYSGNADTFEIIVQTTNNNVRDQIFSFQKNSTARDLTSPNLIAGETFNIEVEVKFQGKTSSAVSGTGQTLPSKGQISIESQTASTIEVEWRALADNVVTSFEIELCDPSDNVVESITRQSQSTYTFEDLQPAVEYEAKIRVVSGDLKSLLPRMSDKGYTAPLPVTDLVATPLTNESILVAFVNSSTAKSYDITYGKVVDRPDAEGTREYSSFPYTLARLKPATDYFIWVVGIANGLESVPAITSSHTLPSDPYNLRVSDRKEGDLTLTWSLNGHFDEFILQYMMITHDPTQSSPSSMTTNKKSISLEGLSLGKTYEFTVYTQFRGYASAGKDTLVYEIPCELEQDKWNEGTHGKWMIFLIVYSILITVLLIVILIVICCCCYKYDWETDSNSSGTGKAYFVSEEVPKGNYKVNDRLNFDSPDSEDYTQPPVETPPRGPNDYSAYLGPEQSTRFDDQPDNGALAIPRAKPRNASITGSEEGNLSVPKGSYQINSSYDID